MIKTNTFFIFTLLLLLVSSACKKEEIKPTVLNPFASFEVSVDKNIVTLVNKSQNGDTHLIDWGDDKSESIGATATVSHIYAGLGSYTIVMKVSNSNGDISTSKVVDIIEKYENGSATTQDASNASPTKLTATFSLADGNADNPSTFKLQLSKDVSFSTLEEINISQLDKVTEVNLNLTDDSFEFKNLTPGETYYYRIHITNNEDDKFSNISQGTTLDMNDVGSLFVGNTTYGTDLMFVSKSTLTDLEDDYLYEDYPEFGQFQFASDNQFNNTITPLMVGNIQDNYYRDANTLIYVKSTLSFKGKTFDFIDSIYTSEKIIARFSDNSYLKSSITQALSAQKTIYLGNSSGERIEIFNVPGQLNVVGNYTITNASSGAGIFYIKYYDASGNEYSVNSTNNATLNIYRIENSNIIYARILGSVSFENTALSLSKSLDGCIFKASL